MPRRNVNTGIWGEPWFEPLSYDAKSVYLFMELNDHTSACGIYIITPERVARELGAGMTVPKVLKAMKELQVKKEPIIQYDEVKSMVYLPFFVRHQRNSGKWMRGVEIALNTLEPHRFIVMFLKQNQQHGIGYKYPIDRVSIAPDTDPDLVLNLKEGGMGGEEKSKPGYLKESFDLFYAEYPNKKSPAVALERWEKLKPEPTLVVKIMLGLAAAKASVDWTLPDGTFKTAYIPHPSTWLNRRDWESDYTSRAAAPPVPQAPAMAITEADINYDALEASANEKAMG